MARKSTPGPKRPKLLAGTIQPGESDEAIIACNDYMRLGPGRSAPKLIKQHQDRGSGTTARAVLNNWSSMFKWSERVSAYDARQEDIKDEARSKVMSEGLALDYQRVTKLKQLALHLEEQIYRELPEDPAEALLMLKAQSGIYPKLIAEYRATLADLAAETGGRKQRSELTGKDGGDLIFRVVYGDDGI